MAINPRLARLLNTRRRRNLDNAVKAITRHVERMAKLDKASRDDAALDEHIATNGKPAATKWAPRAGQ